MSPGYGADESIPPDTERPSPPGPFAISTLKVQSDVCHEEEEFKKKKKEFIKFL